MSYYIYRHLDLNNNIIYVGQTKNIKNRTREHKSMSSWNKEIYRVEYVEVSDKMLMDLYEKYYISKHKPNYNSKDIDCKYSRFFTSLEELDFKEYVENLNPTKETRVKSKKLKYKKPFSESFEEYYKNSIEILNNFKNEFEKSGNIVNDEAYIDNYVACSFVLKSSVCTSALNMSIRTDFDKCVYIYAINRGGLNMNRYNHIKTKEQLKYKSLDELWQEIFTNKLK